MATIVTSEHLAREVERWGGRALVIGVVPVEFIDAAPAELGAGRHVAVINTFSQDEPLADILHAAAQCQRAGQDVTFHITGSLKHVRSRLPDELPANVRFTGWLSEQDYASLLRGVDAVLCLTKHDHTMQRGGYEAMALGQPLITSHWGILRQAFCAGTVHVDNSPRQIAAAVAQVLDDTENPRLRAAMQELARQRSAEFRQRLQQLTTMIKKAL